MHLTLTLHPTLSIQDTTVYINNLGISTMRQQQTKEEVYEFINKHLINNRYQLLSKKEKTTTLEYLVSITGYSKDHLKSMISIYRSGEKITRIKRTEFHFKRKYTQTDIQKLIDINNMTLGMNGKSILKVVRDMFKIYHDKDYENLSNISVSHFYNLKRMNFFRERNLVYQKTQGISNSIGIRMKPAPDGKPGYIRIDSVHQGDSPSGQGLYHINMVDEVLQFELNVAVPYISEEYMKDILQKMLDCYPCNIINFHSDNGSEYINHTVANLLSRLCIKQTKSRPRHSTDNGLVETKNGSVIRHFIPRGYIAKDKYREMNEFFFTYFHKYLNFHRPCLYPTVTLDLKGKKKVTYNECMTPYQKLISIDNYEQYLKPTITKEILKATAMKQNHVECLKEMDRCRTQLLANVHSVFEK